jgi:Fur family transcriptional regulator, ferric uptake regulator
MTDIELKRFRKLLKANDCFITKPRYRLFVILQKFPALTLHELIAKLPQHDQVTVYRNIDLFEKLGIISRIRLGWNTKIELSDMFQRHHHHFTCLKCLKITNLPEDKIVEKRIDRLGIDTGLKITDHQLEIRGLCRICQDD